MRKLAIAILIALCVPAAFGQTDPARARIDAHKSDFDYLLGDWRFTATNQKYGKFSGVWSAMRLGDEAVILDEYRVTGDDGETYYVTRTLRAYDPATDQWDLVSTESANGLQNVGTGRSEGGEVHITQQFGTGTPNAATLRIRYYDIQPDGFSWNADRSTDGGKTWVKDFQHIEAKRIGPPRAMPSITPQKSRPAS